MNNIWVEAEVQRRNLTGTGRMIQLLDVENATAAAQYDISSSLLKQYRHQFAPPSVGKFLTDARTGDPNVFGSGYPFYQVLPEPAGAQNAVHSVRISDSPWFSFPNLKPTTEQYLKMDMTWRFRVYLVWVNNDNTVYPLGRNDWNIRWAGTLCTVDTQYVWAAAPENHNNVSDEFERTNQDLEVPLPFAFDALSAPGGRFQ